MRDNKMDGMKGSQLSIDEECVSVGRAQSTNCRSEEGDYSAFVRELEMGAICSDDVEGDEDCADESVSLEFFDMRKDESDLESQSTDPTEEFIDDETDREVRKAPPKRQKKPKGASSYLRRRNSVIRQRIAAMLFFLVFIFGMWKLFDTLMSRNRRADSTKGFDMSSNRGKDKVRLGVVATRRNNRKHQ